MVKNMNIKRNNMNRYWRPTKNIRFGSSNPYDRQVIQIANALAKKIKVCPQATAREAMSLGLAELARIAGVDLGLALEGGDRGLPSKAVIGGKVILTENAGAAEKHSESVYPATSESQEKNVSNQTAAAV